MPIFAGLSGEPPELALALAGQQSHSQRAHARTKQVQREAEAERLAGVGGQLRTEQARPVARPARVGRAGEYVAAGGAAQQLAAVVLAAQGERLRRQRAAATGDERRRDAL